MKFKTRKILNSIHLWFKFDDIKKLQRNTRLDRNVLPERLNFHQLRKRKFSFFNH